MKENNKKTMTENDEEINTLGWVSEMVLLKRWPLN